MTWRACMQKAAQVLMKAGIEEYESDVRVLAMYVLDCNYTGLTMRMMDEVYPEDEKRFWQCVEMRATHFPCQYITGSQEFMGYTFHTGQEVLIPRPETELLVEEAIKVAEALQSGETKAETKKKTESQISGTTGLAVLDMCCGTGCIGMSFSLCRRATGYNQDSVILADISDYAISLSEENNKNLQAGCNIVQSDLFENIRGRFHMIISNPPYIRSADCETLMVDVKDFEPRLALDGKEDGLYFYDRIIKEAREFLYEDGMLLFEIGYDQLEDVQGLLVDAGFLDIRGIKDYAGLDRIVVARWAG